MSFGWKCGDVYGFCLTPQTALTLRHAVRVSGSDYSIALQTAVRYGWRCTHRLAWRSTAQSGDEHLSHWWAMKGSDDAAKNTERRGYRERESKFVFCLLPWHSPHGLSPLMYELPLYPHNTEVTQNSRAPHTISIPTHNFPSSRTLMRSENARWSSSM